MALDQKDQMLMRDAFYEALDKWSGKNKGGFGGATGGGGSPAPGADKGGLLGKTFDNVAGAGKGLVTSAIDLTGKLAKGGMSVTDATRTLESGLKMAGGAGSGLATALGKGIGAFGDIVQYVEEGVDVFRDLSKTGATFNNSVVDMRAAAAGSRLTMQEFSDILKVNGSNLAALGGSADGGAKAFAKLSKGFFDSGFGDKLTQLGYTSDDLNKLMAIQMTNVSARELEAKGGAKAQYESTVRLAEEMDAMAKIQGVSRKEQEKALEASKADGQKQSAVQLEILNGNKKAGDAFDAVVGSTSGQFGKLVQEMVSSGRPLTEENRKYAGMLSKETQAAIQEARDAYKRGDVEGAREAAKRAQALEAADTATNKSRLALGAQGVEVAKKSFEDQGKYGKLLAEEARKQGTDVKDPKAIAAAQKALEAEAKKGQDARSGETASVIEAQNRIKDMGSAIQESVIVPLKEKLQPELMKFADTLKNLNQGKDKGGTATSKEGFSGDMQAPIKKLAKDLEENLSRGGKKTGPDQKFSDEAAKAANQSQSDALKKALEGNSRQQVAGESNDIKTLHKSLKAVDGEAVSKQLEKIAKDQGKSSADVLKEAVNKPGGVGNLNKALGQDPAAKKVLDEAAAAVKKQQSTGELTKGSEQKGRDTSGTANDALAKGLKAGLDTMGSLVTKSIGVFTVEGDVKIDGKGIGGKGFAEGGVAKGPDSGYFALLHGEETIIPNKDIDSVISGAISKLPVPKAPGEEKSFAESMAADVRKGMQTVGVNPNMQGGGASGLDLSTISKDISTTISSSVAGGGSSSISRKQSKESKNAEDELQVVKDKYVDERSALAAKFAETMPESSARDRRKAMNESDEGKALNAKYEALMKPLEKKIEDGIKWEMNAKETAVDQTEELMSKELLMLKEQGLEKLAITELNEEEIAEMLKQSGADLNDFYVDMNGDLKNWADETASAFDEFAGVDKAVADQKALSEPVMPKNFNEVRTSSADMQAQFDKEKIERKKIEDDAAKAKAEEKKPGAKEAPKGAPGAPGAAASKAATLDQVVEALMLLNSNMSQLLTQSESLGKKQIKASKSGSGNIYDKI